MAVNTLAWSPIRSRFNISEEQIARIYQEHADNKSTSNPNTLSLYIQKRYWILKGTCHLASYRVEEVNEEDTDDGTSASQGNKLKFTAFFNSRSEQKQASALTRIFKASKVTTATAAQIAEEAQRRANDAADNEKTPLLPNGDLTYASTVPEPTRDSTHTDEDAQTMIESALSGCLFCTAMCVAPVGICILQRCHQIDDN